MDIDPAQVVRDIDPAQVVRDIDPAQAVRDIVDPALTTVPESCREDKYMCLPDIAGSAPAAAAGLTAAGLTASEVESPG